MTCCPFKERQTPALIVLVLSIMAAVTGILMIYFSVALNGAEFLDKLQEMEDIKETSFAMTRGVVASSVLTLGLIAICAAIMGAGICKVKSRNFIICYRVVLLSIWIIFLTLGSVAIWFSVAGKDLLMDECVTLIDNLSAKANSGSSNSMADAIGGGFGFDFGSIIGIATGDKCNSAYTSSISINLAVYEAILIDSEMCSSNCPCKATMASEWTSINRSMIGRCREWDFTGNIDNYQDCLVSPPGGSSIPFQVFANEVTKLDQWPMLVDLVSFFEDRYDCAGVCSPALFYFSKSVELGKPGGSCIGNLKDELNEQFIGLGSATFISGILFLAIFVAQYFLWYKYD